MKFLGYIWASIQIDTPWAMGPFDLQLIVWAIGMIVPLALAIGIHFGLYKTVLAGSATALIASASLLVSDRKRSWVIAVHM